MATTQKSIKNNTSDKAILESDVPYNSKRQAIIQKTIYDNIPVGIEIYDKEGCLIYLNQFDIDAFGVLDPNDIIGKSLFDNPNITDYQKERIRAGENFEYELEYDFAKADKKYYKTSSEGRRYFSVKNIAIRNDNNEIEGYMFTNTDITEKCLKQKLLENTQRDLDLALKTGNISIWKYEVDKRIFTPIIGNTTLEYGMSYENALKAVHPDDQEHFIALIDDLKSGKINEKDVILRLYFKNYNGYRYLENKLAIRIDENGNRNIITGTQRDITEDILRKRQLEEYKLKTQLINEKNHIIQWDYDRAKQCIITQGNGAIEEGLAIDKETYLKYTHPEDRHVAEDTLDKMCNGEITDIDIALRVILPNYADYRYTILNGLALMDKNGNITSYTGFRRDATDDYLQRRELDEKTYKTALVTKASGFMPWEYDCNKKIFISEDNEIMGKKLTLEDYLENTDNLDKNKLNEAWQIMREGKDKNFSVDIKYIYNNKWRYATIAGEPYERDATGKVTRYLGYRNNTTDFILMNENIRESKFKTDLAIKNTNMVMWEYVVEEKLFTAFNDPMTNYDATGKFSPAEYISLLDPESIEDTQNAIDKMNRGELGDFSFKSKIILPNSKEWQYLTIHGAHYEVSKEDPTKATKYIGFRIDNTKLITLAQVLEESNELTKNILAQSPSAISIKDVTDNWKYIIANDLFCKQFNSTEKQIIGHNDYEAFSENIADKSRESDLKAINSDDIYSFIEERKLNGETKAYHTTKKTITTQNGRKLLIGISSDITDTITQQKAIEESNERLNMALDVIQAFSWHCDMRDNILRFDSNFSLLGYNADNLNSMYKYAQHIHIDHRQEFLDLMDNFAKRDEGEFISTYLIDLRNNGVYEWHECRGKMKIMTENGVSYKYIYGMDCDVTHHKQITNELIKANNDSEQATTLLQSIIRQIPLGLYIKDIDNDFRYIIMNNVLASINQIDSKDAIGKNDYELFEKRIADILYSEDKMAASHDEGELTVIKSTLDRFGQISTYENSNTVIKVANGNRLLIGLVTDVTEKERMLTELKESKERAIQSDKLKSAFLANMSHEIRTPLNAIVGFSELLIEAETQEERNEYTNIISVNNELLLRLIGDILDLSKIESGMMELKIEAFDVSEVSNDVFMTLKQKLTNSDISFSIDNPYKSCIVELDKNRFKQVGINFITNAIKYTAKGTIKMGYRYENNGIKIYVEDTGIGIAQKNYHKVFQRFEKFDSFAQGTGLGLSICKAIVSAQGGNVGFESEEGKGSTFWAWFPCSARIQEMINIEEIHEITNTVDTSEITMDNTDFKILIAEDNDSNFLLIKHMLKTYNIVRAVNGEEAVNKIKAEHFNIILMDIKMPIMTGLEATLKIREFNKEIPIIAVTANVFDSERESIFKAGCNAFVAKPLKKKELIDAIALFQ